MIVEGSEHMKMNKIAVDPRKVKIVVFSFTRNIEITQK